MKRLLITTLLTAAFMSTTALAQETQPLSVRNMAVAAAGVQAAGRILAKGQTAARINWPVS